MASSQPDERFHETPLTITAVEFQRLRDLIRRHTGIALSDHKHALVSARLGKRLRHYGLTRYADYYDLLTKTEGGVQEIAAMINAITTNKTDFFREAHHFEFLRERVFPALQARSGRRPLLIWSAGTSTGEEAYSIAMTALETVPSCRNRDLKILATDIDTDVLERARAGIYPLDQARQIPEPLRQRYLLRGCGQCAGQVQAKPALKDLIRFRRLNLMDDPWPMRGPFDVIFCRNVLIYFDKPTQLRMVARFREVLRPDGHLMLGHSEALHGFECGFDPVGHSIYRYGTRH